jgi:hypothetical protein
VILDVRLFLNRLNPAEHWSQKFEDKQVLQPTGQLLHYPELESKKNPVVQLEVH